MSQTELIPANPLRDPLCDPLADLPWQPLPRQAVAVHFASLLRLRERTVTVLDRRLTLGAWLRRAGHDLVTSRTICAVNGEWMPRARWTRYRPQPGDQILLLDHPHAGGGDGSNPLAAVLMIAAIIIAPYAAPAIAGAIGVSTVTAQALFMLGANLLISALASPSKALSSHAQSDLASASPTYSLAAQGNSNRLGSPRPRHYGKFRFTPAYCAQPYAEFESNEQYLYETLDVGLGHYQIDQITIEDSDIDAFSDIDYEVIPPGGTITLVPSNVQNAGEVAGQELLLGTWIGGEDGFIAVLAGTTSTAIGVDIVCPYGLFKVDEHDGDLMQMVVQVRFEAAVVNDVGVRTGAWFTLGDITHSAATNTAQRKSARWSVPAARYAVRATRLDVKDTDSNAGHEVTWAGLRAYLPTVLSFPDNTVIAMRAKATGQLTQASSRKVFVKGVAKLPTWSPAGGWTVPVATRSIAWAAADILMADYGRGAPAASIDFDRLYQLEQVWALRGDSFDASFDTRSTVAEALTACLKAGRAQWFQVAGLFSFARDEAVTIPSAVFTPQNIVRGSVEVEYVMPGDKTADHVIAKYFDTTVFGWREVECKLDGSSSTKPASITYFGIGDRSQAWREGVTDAAENLYRRRIVTFQSEMEGRLLLPLDTIGLTHHLITRSQTGEVVAFSGDDGDGGLTVGAQITLTAPLDFAAGEQHYLVMSTLTGGRSGPWRVSAGPSPEIVVLQDAVAGFQPYVGGGKQRSRFAFGIGAEVYLLGKVVPPLKPKGRNVEIKMVIDDPRVHQADQTNTPPPPGVGWGLPKAPAAPVLASILVAQNGEPANPVITVNWPSADGAAFYVIEWSANAVDWQRAGGDTTGNNISFTVPAGPLHIHACAVGKVAGPWKAWSGVAGEVPPPGRPQGLMLVEAWLSTTARWKWSAGARAASYDVEIYADSTLRRSFNGAILGYTYDAEQITADGGPWRSVEIRVRSVGPTGVSDWASLISVNPQVGVLSGVAFVPGYLQVVGTYSLPADTDFSGVRVAMSQTAGFDQSLPENLAYDGYDQIFVLTQGPGGVAFATDQVWYLRIAGYDKFGTDSLTWSAEHSVTIAGVDANMTPEEVLAKLNSSFVQGNVVLAGAGAITVYNGAPSVPNRDFVALTAGTISFQRYRDGQYREYKSLKRVEAGSAPSGQTVTLPGYWDTQPKVTVSPQSLMSYLATYGAQDQTWACRADNLREDPAASGIWKFDAVAELQLSSAAGTTSINQATGDTASNSWDSSIYTLPANTHDITVNVQVKSKRGTGAHTAEWAYRSVLVQVYAYASSAGWYVAGSKTIAPGTVLDSFISGSVVCPSLVSGTTQFYVRYTASDAGGTWYSSGDVYDYSSTDTVIGSNGSRGYSTAHRAGSPITYYGFDQNFVQDPNSYGGYARGVYHMPAYSVPAGWEVTSVSYSCQWQGYAGAGLNIIAPNGVTFTGQGCTGVLGEWGSYSKAYRAMAWNRAGAYDPEAVAVYSAGTSSATSVQVKDVVATINRRYLHKNSASPVNAFTLSNYSWQLSSASALATGSINYLAVGD